METLSGAHAKDFAGTVRLWLGAILLMLGLFGHIVAAHDIGGSRIAYQHHIFGFVAGTVLTAAILAPLQWHFWKGRYDISLLILGVIQAAFGLYVYIERFNIG